jgi:hypothetical protein
MTRVHQAKPADFKRLTKSKVESRRPVCGWCGLRFPDKRSAAWAGFGDPYGHRQPWAPFDPCPSWKTREPIAPPPPRPQPVPRTPQHGPTISVAEWWAWFEAQPVAERPARTRVKREAQPVARAADQLVLFTADGVVWCELRDAPAGLRLGSENSQGRPARGDNQGAMLRLVARGGDCGRG